MKKYFNLIIVLACYQLNYGQSSVNSCAFSSNVTMGSVNNLCDTNYTTALLVYHDEFNENFLNSEHWEILVGGPTEDKLRNWYSKDNVEVSNGTLKLFTKKENHLNKTYQVWSGAQNQMVTVGPHNYDMSCGYVKSKFRIYNSWGVWEARIKLPTGRCLRPAFWLYDGSPWKEIDIFEFTDNSKCLTTTVHQHVPATNQKEQCLSTHNTNQDLSSAFHVYRLEWSPHWIMIFLDGNLVNTITRYRTLAGQAAMCDNSSAPFLLNEALPIYKNMEIKFSVEAKDKFKTRTGCTSVNERTCDLADYSNSTMEIDYVRVYQVHDCDPLITITDPNDLNTDGNILKYFMADEIVLDVTKQMPAGSFLGLYANKITTKVGFWSDPGASLLQEIRPLNCLDPVARGDDDTNNIYKTQFLYKDILSKMINNQTVEPERVPFFVGNYLDLNNGNSDSLIQKVKVYNPVGQLLALSKDKPLGKVYIPNLKPGVYIVQFVNSDGSFISHKIFKKAP